MAKPLPLGKTSLLHIGLLPCPCICHDTMNAFGCKLIHALHQYLGQPRSK
jgi:hypothetical protein